MLTRSATPADRGRHRTERRSTMTQAIRDTGGATAAQVPAGAAKGQEEVLDVRRTTCCVVGGGPGGAVLALLLARKGVDVTLLEAHPDFDREFRGDTLHP